MRAPVLEILRPASVPPGIPSASSSGQSAAEGVELFLVVRSGDFSGQKWSKGQVLVCRGTPRTGDAVVLVSRGRLGRPHLGRVEGTRFLGEAGEPCHPARWRAAGRVVAVGRNEGEGWVVDLLSAPAPGSSGEGFPVAETQLALPVPVDDLAQLSLFAA